MDVGCLSQNGRMNQFVSEFYSVVRVDVEEVLVYLRRVRMGKAPAERRGLSQGPHPDAGVSVPALEQRSGLLTPLGPEHAKMTLAGSGSPGMCERRDSQRKRDRAAQTQASNVITVPHHDPARTSRKGSDP